MLRSYRNHRPGVRSNRSLDFPFAKACIASAALVVVLTSCTRTDEDDPGGIEIVALSPRPASNPDGTPLFERIAPADSGVDFLNPIDTSHPLKRLYHSGFVCGGCAIGDVDGDRRPDLYFVSGPKANRLYLQRDTFRFEDVTEAAGVGGGDRWGTGGAMADVDGDGDLDLYVCNYDAPNQLFVNDGSGRFTERAKGSGLDLTDASLLPTFCDFDRDGDLDVFVLTNRYYREGGRPSSPPVEQDPRTGLMYVKPEFAKYYYLRKDGQKYEIDEVARPDYLLRNDGPGADGVPRFTDVTKEAGVSIHGYGLSATWWDYDRDGWPDIYVANDFADPDQLYRNNGDGSFTDVLANVVPHTPWFSMGADVGDVNGDGALDFVVLDMAATTHYKSKMSMGEMGKFRRVIERTQPRQVMRNALYIDTGTGRFLESAVYSGIANTDWSWAAKLRDFDGDGWNDLFVSNGAARDFNNSDVPFSEQLLIGRNIWDLYEHLPAKREQNIAFRNRGDLRFDDVSAAWGLDHTGMSYAAAHGDLDADGDLDLVVVNLDEPVSVYRNQSTAAAHAAIVRLRGRAQNRWGVGAYVRVKTASGVYAAEQVPVSGYLSSNQPEVHFGLGAAETITELRIEWPSGAEQTFTDLPVDRAFIVSEPGGAAKPKRRPREGEAKPHFARSRALRGVRHVERVYEDFVRQPLLPNKYSQLGPGVAWADVDRDGDDDVFIGAGRGSAGAVLVADGPGPDGAARFRVAPRAAFEAHADAEDMGALFFDADRDGDEDLYVASGSYEYEVDSPQLADRLYLNDGTGRFVPAPEGALPPARDSASVVCAADFDRDGDLDLFVGGRLVPGEYPLSGRSHLLRNESTPGSPRFVDAAPDVVPELTHSGLVTSAVWSDADADGWIDLLVTHEWGPVKLYRNEEGRLVDATPETGVANVLGWWNSISAGDIDGDGDTDYAVGNQGLNSKYHASAKKPVLLYYGDYAGDGTKRLVEAEFENETLFPIRGRSCSSAAMPHLRDKFKTFHDFAIAGLEEIYEPKCLDEARRFEANTLESGVFVNDGGGRFEFRPLPSLVQLSPVFGIEFVDFDGDGNLDLYCAQNFFQPQFETGPYDSGMSVLLRGSADGTFAAVWPRESGLIVPGDARSLTRTDLNRDGAVDFVVAINNGELVAFEASSVSASPPRLTVRLAGRDGNLRATGARVTVHFEGGSTRSAEVYAGGGYLAQSSADVSFGLGGQPAVQKITVRWPDGTTSSHPGNHRGAVELTQP